MIGFIEDEDPVGGSLNAGAELDDETPVLFEDPVAGEVPELDDTAEVLFALESKIQDFEYLMADIRASKGMTQGFALEAERIDPGALVVPVGYFTKAPSATRLQVSMEAFSKRIMALIAAAIAAAIAAIWRFFGRKGAGDSENPKTEGAKAEKELDEKIRAADKNAETLKKQADATADLVSDVRAGKFTKTDGEQVAAITLDSLLEDLWGDTARHARAKQFMRHPHPIFNDILAGGEYTKAWRSIAPSLAGLSGVFKQKAQALVQIQRADQMNSSVFNAAMNSKRLFTVDGAVEISFLGSKCTLREAADRLSTIRQEVERSANVAPMSLDRMVSAVSSAYDSSDVKKFFQEQRDIVEVFVNLADELALLEKKAADFSADGKPGHNSEQIAPQLRDVVFAVAKDVAAYNALFAELNTYGLYLDKLARETMGFAVDLERQVHSLAQRKMIEVPEQWRKDPTSRPESQLEALFSRLHQTPSNR